ncbi:hypothetical protein [Saccharopolyspora griseoalba]|uniref:Small secreted protein n=1 Tax=Saccharopolyspora griseoalba TaxID=1431848 RepID=A0ABW2LH28_9PSEU
MNIRRTSVAVLAAIPLALSACGTPQAGAPEPKAPTTEQVQWAGKMCGLVTGFSQKQKQLPPVDKTNTQTVKDSISARLDAASGAADETVNGLKGLGPAPINGADEVNQSFQQGFGEVRDVLKQARAVAGQIDVRDKQKFNEGVAALQNQLKKSNQIDLAGKFGKLEQTPELKRAAERAPECKPFFQQKPQQQQPAPPQQPPADKPG